MRKRLWFAFSALLLIAVVGFLLAGQVFHLFAGTLACHTWQSKVTAPLQGTTQFASISLVAPNDVWLAGSNNTPDTHVTRPLVEHWDGQHWQALFPITPSTSDATIRGIAAVSDSDVWAVGGAYSDPGDMIPLAQHWDGHAWHALSTPITASSVTTPNTGRPFSFTHLDGIAALASDNVWAVGTFSGPGFSQTLIQHWDGSRWQRVPSPNVADENNQLAGVSAHSANDIWAVGTSQGYQGSALTLTEHWDGSRWSIVSSPDPSRVANALASVAAAASDEVWAVGEQAPEETGRVSAGGSLQAHDPVVIGPVGLIEHWDGQRWQVSSFPKLGQHQLLVSVTAYSSRDVWAVGLFVVDSNEGQVWHGLLERWNGSSWQSTEDTHAQYLTSIATSAAGGLWSVGLTVPAHNAGGSQQAVAEVCT